MKVELNKNIYIDLYRNLKIARRFGEKIIELGNTGEIPGFIHSAVGMEAPGVGICYAMQKDDIVVPTHRKPAQLLTKGADIKYMMAEYMGKATGFNHGKGGELHCSPDLETGVMSVESQVAVGLVPISCGIALASKLRNENRVVVSFYGDGGANEGAVHESMNMAAVFNLPVLFVCDNNQYAVTTPAENSSKLKNLSKRADSYGFSGKTIDGMDVIDIYSTAKEIIEKIRKGSGPFLLECKSYRFHGHYSGEDLRKLEYRTKEEIEFWKSRCPVKLCSEYLIEKGICNKEELDEIDESVESTVAEAVEFARNSKYPEPEDALKDMYATEYEGIPDKGWV
jgi:pyruvate dehydrogenase E1 component alpha subunit